MRSQRHPWLSLSLLLVCLLTLGGLSVCLAPSAEAVLPPRPTVSAGNAEDSGPTPAPTVAHLSLVVTPTQPRYWSVVQWQDAQGAWHDVTGWRGDVVDGSIHWWVEEKDFGKGPFRWAVYQPGGPIIQLGEGRFVYRGEQALLALSQPFYLPAGPSQSLTIYVAVLAR